MRRVIVIAAWGFALGACSASLPSLDFLKLAPPTEVLRIESDPPGAEARTTQGQACRTPCELKLQANNKFSVMVSLDGYQPQTVPVAAEAAPEVAAAAPRFAPNPVYVELVPAAAAASGKKQPGKKPKQKAAPAAARSKTAADTTTASALVPASGAAPTSAPSAEPAASATNYPWPSR
jgi:PEGA domain